MFAGRRQHNAAAGAVGDASSDEDGWEVGHNNGAPSSSSSGSRRVTSDAAASSSTSSATNTKKNKHSGDGLAQNQIDALMAAPVQAVTWLWKTGSGWRPYSDADCRLIEDQYVHPASLIYPSSYCSSR